MSGKKRSKKGKWITISIVLIVVAGLIAVIMLRPKEMNYESIVAKTSDIATYYSFSGNIETKNRQTVLSEKVMQIETLNVKDGDLVNEGDVLIKSTTGDEIKAKIAGEIVNLKVEESMQVMSGVRLMEIVDYDNLRVSVKVGEYDLKAVVVGKEVTVRIDALGTEIKGTIGSVSKEGQTLNGVTFFLTTIDLEKNSALKVGLSTEVTMLSEKAAGVVILPIKAILFDNDNNPYVLKKDDKALPVRTSVTTGINDGTSVEIASGVSNGETVLFSLTASPATGLFGGRPSTGNTGGTR